MNEDLYTKIENIVSEAMDDGWNLGHLYDYTDRIYALVAPAAPEPLPHYALYPLKSKASCWAIYDDPKEGPSVIVVHSRYLASMEPRFLNPLGWELGNDGYVAAKLHLAGLLADR